MISDVKRIYLDIVWFLDGIPIVRWVKCLIGLHVPVEKYILRPVSYDGVLHDHVQDGWQCGYCRKPLPKGDD